eukprot:COSAG02_NODE_51886_length_311_cov_0.830189_2_plen_36_part_01
MGSAPLVRRLVVAQDYQHYQHQLPRLDGVRGEWTLE